MKDKQLSGIERELVLQYLIDGNVPVTITPLETKTENNSKIKSITSQVFPIAIKAEHLRVRDNGQIILENPTKKISTYIGQQVKVEFYFNRVGLSFISELQTNNVQVTDNSKNPSTEVFILLPDVIDRIEDVEEDKKYSFSGLIYFEYKNKKDLNLNCYPWENIELFSRPVWKIIPLEKQQKAKTLLEKMVAQAKKDRSTLIGNGIQLIPICHYLTYDFEHKIEAMENRKKPVDILYIDHERIVFGCSLKDKVLLANNEYGLKISFTLDKGPISTRDIYITFIVSKEYYSSEVDITSQENVDVRVCFDCKYTTIQEEDLRYLYEKATKSLLI